MHTSLEDILNGSASQKTVAEPQEAETTAPVESEPHPSSASPEASTGDTEPPAPSATPPVVNDEPLDKKIAAFQRKAEDETRKRQDYEKQLAEARAAIAERDRLIEAERQRLAQIAAQQQQQEIDLYDPEQAKAYVHSILAQERAAIQQNLLVQKVVTSQELMRSQHSDYDELEGVFAEEMERNPDLQHQMWSDPFPAKFAYNYAKRALAMRQIGDDPNAFIERERERIRQEERAALQSQAPAPSQIPTPHVPQPPKTLAGVPSAARNVTKQPWAGPTPLSKILS